MGHAPSRTRAIVKGYDDDTALSSSHNTTAVAVNNNNRSGADNNRSAAAAVQPIGTSMHRRLEGMKAPVFGADDDEFPPFSETNNGDRDECDDPTHGDGTGQSRRSARVARGGGGGGNGADVEPDSDENCSYSSFQSLSCSASTSSSSSTQTDADGGSRSGTPFCERVVRRFRHCANRPAEEMVKNEDGEWTWKPAKQSDVDRIGFGFGGGFGSGLGGSGERDRGFGGSVNVNAVFDENEFRRSMESMDKAMADFISAMHQFARVPPQKNGKASTPTSSSTSTVTDKKDPTKSLSD